MADYGATERVRSSAAKYFVIPARQRREKTFQIHSGTFAKALVAEGLLAPNRYPLVCNALRSRRFLEDNKLRLTGEKTNASSGLSSDVTFTYALGPPGPRKESGPDLLTEFDKLRGALKGTYAAFGGAERAIQSEREAWEH